MFESQDIEVVNIVASGKFNVELDLAAVAEDLRKLDNWITEVEHSRRSGNRLLIYFTDNDALCILAPSGVYVFNGVDNYEKIEDANEKLLRSLSHLGIISSRNPSEEEVIKKLLIRNIVCTADFGRNMNLNAVSIGLGFENIEYEPEQFPGLVYKPQNHNFTVMIFSTGKMVIMGVQSERTAREAFELVTAELENV
jgi:transcription initiation factor TFIID TATA-box-binding protein